MSLAADVLLLAAGEGRRAGGPKAWIEIDGRPWLKHQLDALRAVEARAVRVVLAAPPPARWAQLVAADCWSLNPQPELGPFSSLQTGLRALQAPPLPVFVLPVDVPAPAADAFRALMEALGLESAAVPVFGGHGGHPVLLSASACSELLRLSPLNPESRLDRWLRGAGDGVRRIDIKDPRVTMDLNAPEDFAEFGRAQ